MPHYWKRKPWKRNFRKCLTFGAKLARVLPMENRDRKFHKVAPEIKPWVEKYGCSLNDEPQFILLGHYTSTVLGPVMGILAAAQNEFHAHILRREFNRNGKVEVMRSEFHSDPNFSIVEYRAKIRARMEKKEAE